MNKTVATICERADRLVTEKQHAKAENVLRQALQKRPAEPELHAKLGFLLCCLQREDEALQCLAACAGAPSEPKLAQTLIDHLHCRRKMADKLGLKDTPGANMLRKIERLSTRKPGKVGIKLSACLIVRNEEKNLRRCLASLKGIADEIVVVDTGSSDGTVAIAEEFGCKVGHFLWQNDFAAARNYALELATGDWALWIDADEELAPKSAGAVREALIRPHFGGFALRILNFLDDKPSGNHYVHTPVRIFRNVEGVCFVGRIHEQVLPSLLQKGLPIARLSGAQIYHYGYCEAAMLEKNKLERTVSMLLREVAEFPNDPFQWFNLANAYMVGLRYEEAIPAAQRCLELIEAGVVEIDRGYVGLAYHILCSALAYVGRLDEALEACDRAKAAGFGGVLNEFECAHTLLKLERYDGALKAINRAMKLEWPEEQVGDYGVVTHKSHVVRAQILAQMNRLEEALSDVDHALSVAPDFTLAVYTKGVILAKLGQGIGALPYLERCFEAGKQGFDAMLASAEVHLQLGDANRAKALLAARFDAGAVDAAGFQFWIAACERTGDLPEALRAYEQYAARHTLSADENVNWARSLATAGLTRAALDRLTEAIRLDPLNANAYYNCGDLLFALGQAGAAANAYEAGLKLDPQNAAGWFVMGNCLMHQGNPQGARLCYEQAVLKDPGHAAARHNLQLIPHAEPAGSAA